jgi:type II secretory pathway pseudopilin PulG
MKKDFKNKKGGPASHRQAKASRGGYTLIETIISLALFIVVVTIGMGALLNASALYNKSKNMRSIMDSLSFTMEDMSRNLRTGTNYRCITASGNSDFSPITTAEIPKSGQSCWGIVFEPSGGTPSSGDQWIYYIGTLSPDTTVRIYKSVDIGGAQRFVQMTPDEVTIDQSYGFSVLGAEPPSTGDQQQPFVTIRLVGHILYNGVSTPFSLQTSVSQRETDL